MMNLILNVIGWMPLWALLLCGAWAYVRLGYKFVMAFFHNDEPTD